MLLFEFLHSWPAASAEPPDEYAPLIGRGPPEPRLPTLPNRCMVILTSSLLDPQLGGLEFGKRGGVSEPDESPDEPNPNGNRGGVKVPVLPPLLIESMAQGLKRPCSNMAIAKGSGTTGMPIMP